MKKDKLTIARAIFAIVIALVIYNFLNGIFDGSDSTKESKTEQTTTKKSSSSEESSSTSSSTEAELPRITAEQMPDFIEYLQNDLTEKGLDISLYSFTNKDNALYMTVPNDYKYYEKNDLQKFVDGIQAKEHEAFNVWSAMNGVDYNLPPMLFIKTEDGESLASQTAFSGKMELKID
ncbi:Uncharacterised protein [Streptococcus equi subsp. equi]|uniref:hypothetical protein n=1 Tax=Streptococcus equi TaxID=1336 RepID=UPI00065943E8|nr:Uncharacterised protein [Streptococcus equi subsp. equi]